MAYTLSTKPLIDPKASSGPSIGSAPNELQAKGLMQTSAAIRYLETRLNAHEKALKSPAEIAGQDDGSDPDSAVSIDGVVLTY